MAKKLSIRVRPSPPGYGEPTQPMREELRHAIQIVADATFKGDFNAGVSDLHTALCMFENVEPDALTTHFQEKKKWLLAMEAARKDIAKARQRVHEVASLNDLPGVAVLKNDLGKMITRFEQAKDWYRKPTAISHRRPAMETMRDLFDGGIKRPQIADLILHSNADWVLPPCPNFVRNYQKTVNGTTGRDRLVNLLAVNVTRERKRR